MMAKMDKLSGIASNWPILRKVEQFADWKEKFEAVVKSEDVYVWSCMIDGYIVPTRQIDGRTIVIRYEEMDESEKQVFNAESEL